MNARAALLSAGLATFDTLGYERATVEAIRTAAGVSNGSFFHAFRTKEALAAAVFIEALRSYHDAIVAPLGAGPGAAEGVAALISAHLGWVSAERSRAKFLFEQSRAEWFAAIADEQRAANGELEDALEHWRRPLVEAGALWPMSPLMFFSQLIGPAQIFCRAWLGGRSSDDPREQADALTDCAIRTLCTAREIKRVQAAHEEGV